MSAEATAYWASCHPSVWPNSPYGASTKLQDTQDALRLNSIRSIADGESRSCDAHVITGKANQRSPFLNLAHNAVVVVLRGSQRHAVWWADKDLWAS